MPSTIDQFLKEKGFHPDLFQERDFIESFVKQMDEGLKGNPQSLAMLPTYLNPFQSTSKNQSVIALDAGGTNLRVSLLHFDQEGRPEILEQKKYPMPGKDSEISSNDFYQTLANNLSEYLAKTDHIGFCFSYPCEINQDKDGKLLYWTKEIKAPEVEGQWIAKELNKVLSQNHHGTKQINLLNDTAATLLAGKALFPKQTFDIYLGLILGTGANCAYSEANHQIKANASDEGHQVINIESGNFNGLSRSAFDIELDSLTENPGNYFLEKALGGRYLGELFLIILKACAKQRFFNATLSEALIELKQLASQDLSAILKQQQDSSKATGIHCYDHADDESKSKILYVAQLLLQRTAKLTAANIVSPLIHHVNKQTSSSIKNKTQINKALVTIDGSTYYHLPGLQAAVEAYVGDYLKGYDIDVQFNQVDDAPILGAAIASINT